MTSRGASRCGGMSLSSRTLLTAAASPRRSSRPPPRTPPRASPPHLRPARSYSCTATVPRALRHPQGHGPRRRRDIVGLDRAPSGELLALTSAGNIASVDRDTGKATAKFAAPVTAAVDPNAALTFAVAPDGASARIITAGRDVPSTWPRGRDGRLGPRPSPPATPTPASRPLRRSTTRPTGA